MAVHAGGLSLPVNNSRLYRCFPDGSGPPRSCPAPSRTQKVFKGAEAGFAAAARLKPSNPREIRFEVTARRRERPSTRPSSASIPHNCSRSARGYGLSSPPMHGWVHASPLGRFTLSSDTMSVNFLAAGCKRRGCSRPSGPSRVRHGESRAAPPV